MTKGVRQAFGQKLMSGTTEACDTCTSVKGDSHETITITTGMALQTWMKQRCLPHSSAAPVQLNHTHSIGMPTDVSLELVIHPSEPNHVCTCTHGCHLSAMWADRYGGYTPRRSLHMHMASGLQTSKANGPRTERSVNCDNCWAVPERCLCCAIKLS